MGRSKAAQRLARRQEVWDLRCQGWTQQRIADQLEVNQSTISRDLAFMRERVMDRMEEDIVQTKVEQVWQLEYMINELFEAWRKSKEAARSVSRMKDEGGGSGFIAKGKGGERTNTTVSDRTGKVSYLREARNAMADIRKILGADAPIKIAPTDPSGKEQFKGPWDLSDLTNEELEMLANLIRVSEDGG